MVKNENDVKEVAQIGDIQGVALPAQNSRCEVKVMKHGMFGELWLVSIMRTDHATLLLLLCYLMFLPTAIPEERIVTIT